MITCLNLSLKSLVLLHTAAALRYMTPPLMDVTHISLLILKHFQHRDTNFHSHCSMLMHKINLIIKQCYFLILATFIYFTDFISSSEIVKQV